MLRVLPDGWLAFCVIACLGSHYEGRARKDHGRRFALEEHLLRKAERWLSVSIIGRALFSSSLEIMGRGVAAPSEVASVDLELP